MQLVFLEPNKINAIPFTTSDVVAEYAKVKHHAVQVMISKHEDDVKEFGLLSFEMSAVKMKRGVKYEKVYHLNEEQATLLVTYLKNTEPVRRFKKELVRQFFAMRQELMNIQGYRAELKPIRREMTDVIKERDQSKWAYKKYTDLAYIAAVGKTAKKLREERGAKSKAIAADYMTADELRAIAEMQYKIAVLLQAGMEYQQIKAALSKPILARVG